ncbi:MAG: lipoyl(octanoyl) transferase LipB [Thermodesulfobacteriota bacterium]
MSVTAASTPAAGWPGRELATLEQRHGRPLRCRWLGRIAFPDALALQEQVVREHAAIGDTLLLLEHDPVYTTGRGGRVEHLGVLAAGDGAAYPPLVRIGRGGDVTYHGPGQLVGYGLVDLRARGGDLHRFLRDLEAGVVATARALGVAAVRWPGRTGVWAVDADLAQLAPGELAGRLDDAHMAAGRVRKIASIGIGVRRGVTMHGFALNVALDLAPFAAIVPCGLAGVRMTSVAAETGRTTPALVEVAALASWHVGAALAGDGVRPLPSRADLPGVAPAAAETTA